MKKLLELEDRLKKAKEELEKSLLGDMNPISTDMGKMDGMAGAADVNTSMGKEDVETCGTMDSKKDQKIIAEALDDHNEKKHGEAKDEDSAKKSDIPKEITDQSSGEIIEDVEKPKPMEKGESELVKFHPNGQWSINKSDHMAPRANGEFDVPVKEVYDGDDQFVHVGNRGVEGDDKGKTQKLSDKEKKLLKD